MIKVGKPGFFAVGVHHPKTETNVGTLWRSALLCGAAFVFTVGRRYHSQSSDTVGTPLRIPLMHFDDIDDVVRHLPHGCPLVGVELDPRATPLMDYTHRTRASYLLGAEDHGLPPRILDRCHDLVRIENAVTGDGAGSYNVAVAGSIVMHHRMATRER